MTADDRLHRLLGGDHLAALRKRLRRRFEQNVSEPILRIGQLTATEHAALAALTGRPPRFAGSLQIDLAAIDDSLRQAGIAASLRDALERLGGPIVDAAAERTNTQVRWAAVADRPAHEALKLLLRIPAALGLLKRLAGGDAGVAATLCDKCDAVLQRLPAHGLTRAQLAAVVLGDAHALDTGRAVATLVLAALRGMTPEPGLNDETARGVWARVGVLVNELARPALWINLPFPERTNTTGEPGFLSLRALVRSPPKWDVAGRDVYVCENPNLLAIAADHLGCRCPPMVCTEGMPAAAQARLLSQLARSGALLHYHGDFDWAGLRIGNHVMREFGARPWRFGSTDYLTAIEAATTPGHRLTGEPVAAAWDKELAPVMSQHQVAIAEEAVAKSLLQDVIARSTATKQSV